MLLLLLRFSWRWFCVVDSSCWFVDFHCWWFQFSSEDWNINSYWCQQFNCAWSTIFFSQVFASRLYGCTPSAYILKLYCVLVASFLWSPFLYLDFICRSFENFGEWLFILSFSSFTFVFNLMTWSAIVESWSLNSSGELCLRWQFQWYIWSRREF